MVAHLSSNRLVYLGDGSAQTIVRAATPRQKVQIKLAISPSRGILTPVQPVPAMALMSQAPGREKPLECQLLKHWYDPTWKCPHEENGNLPLFLRAQLHLLGSPFFCVPSYISGVHHSSSSAAFPATSLRFTILLLLLRFQLYLWGSPFFFCLPSYISSVHDSSSAFPAISLRFTILLLLLRSPAISVGFTILLLLLLRSPAISLGFTFLLLLLRSPARSLGSPFFFFCVPQVYLWVHHSSSSSSSFPAISLRFTILLLLLRSQLYLRSSPYWARFFAHVTIFESNHRGTHIPSS